MKTHSSGILIGMDIERENKKNELEEKIAKAIDFTKVKMIEEKHELKATFTIDKGEIDIDSLNFETLKPKQVRKTTNGLKNL